ncbi:MAG: anthranilate synthase component I family protein [bacterium]
MVDISSPSLYFPDSGSSHSIHLNRPDAWIALSPDGNRYFKDGLDRFDPPEDPFVAIDRFFDRFDTGFVAGAISYDLTYWNHDVASIDQSDNSTFPLFVLAHYSQRRSQKLPMEELPQLGSFESTVQKKTYHESVERIREYIRQGYVYQVNLSQRFTTSVDGPIIGIMHELDLLPPHSAYLDIGSHEALSLSPERFMAVNDRSIITEPIKGTRPRTTDPLEDAGKVSALASSQKDNAEHTMIVDLERNDLNRICETGSVHVPSLSRVESFPTVHHLVSTVSGELRESVTPGKLFRNIFPGGSITGAPKSTAVRVIHELENRRRGLYTGTIGYWDLDEGLADWNLAIRTLVRRGNRAWWDAGGGIVIDSDPKKEYRESLDKTQLIRGISQ